jgi:DNA mismatch endonuclease, patch repair protein
MRAVRQRATKPELIVRSALKTLGYRFRSNDSSLPGQPDLVHREGLVAIFVHGCFWHRHKNCGRSTMPGRNVELWAEKFEANQRRDRRNIRALKTLGYHVIVIWECQVRDADVARTRLERLVRRIDACLSGRMA